MTDASLFAGVSAEATVSISQAALSSASDPAQQGQEDAQYLLDGFSLDHFPGGVYDPGADEGIFALSASDVSSALDRASTDSAYAEAFFETLGPEATATLIGNYDALVSDTDSHLFNEHLNISPEDGAAMLQSFATALGSASHSPTFDGATFMDAMTNTSLSNTLHDGLDPEIVAILVNEGDYSPEAAAELGEYVLLNSDPPNAEPSTRSEMNYHAPHREALLSPYEGASNDAIGAWPTALRGLLRNEASSEVLAIQSTREVEGTSGQVTETYAPVAERLMDADIQSSNLLDDGPRVNELPSLVGAVLEQPVYDLRSNENDAAAMSAVESLVMASSAEFGRVNEQGANALGALYTEFAPEILNAGEDAAAFPLALNSPLGRFLAHSSGLDVGDGSHVIAGALQATDTPPLDPSVASNAMPNYSMQPVYFESWSDAVNAATSAYREEIVAHGPPTRDVIGGEGTYPDLDGLATEIGQIDAFAVQGIYGAAVVREANLDSANQQTQDIINGLTDYAGFAAGLYGPTLSYVATALNTHVEADLLESRLPTDNAEGAFGETVPALEQTLVLMQAETVVRSAAQHGLIDLPPGLADADGNLHPRPEGEAEQAAYYEELTAFVQSNQELWTAVSKANGALEENLNALETGHNRGE